MALGPRQQLILVKATVASTGIIELRCGREADKALAKVIRHATPPHALSASRPHPSSINSYYSSKWCFNRFVYSMTRHFFSH